MRTVQQGGRIQGDQGGQPQYLVSTAQQSQQPYDADMDLVNTIAAHLSNLSDDEVSSKGNCYATVMQIQKVVTKMNITRIIMDARFGNGACVRMFREVAPRLFRSTTLCFRKSEVRWLETCWATQRRHLLWALAADEAFPAA